MIGGLSRDQHGVAIINKAVLKAQCCRVGGLSHEKRGCYNQAVLKMQCCLAGGGLGHEQHGVALQLHAVLPLQGAAAGPASRAGPEVTCCRLKSLGFLSNPS